MSVVRIYRVHFDFEMITVSNSNLAALGRCPLEKSGCGSTGPLQGRHLMRKSVKVGAILFIFKIANALETRGHTCLERKTNYSVMSSSVTWWLPCVKIPSDNYLNEDSVELSLWRLRWMWWMCILYLWKWISKVQMEGKKKVGPFGTNWKKSMTLSEVQANWHQNSLHM